MLPEAGGDELKLLNALVSAAFQIPLAPFAKGGIKGFAGEYEKGSTVCMRDHTGGIGYSADMINGFSAAYMIARPMLNEVGQFLSRSAVLYLIRS
jgi:hypothetical protein